MSDRLVAPVHLRPSVIGYMEAAIAHTTDMEKFVLARIRKQQDEAEKQKGAADASWRTMLDRFASIPIQDDTSRFVEMCVHMHRGSLLWPTLRAMTTLQNAEEKNMAYQVRSQLGATRISLETSLDAWQNVEQLALDSYEAPRPEVA